MESQGSLCLLWALLACYLFSSSLAYSSLYVGGEDGWVTNPSESYNHWAERNRFQVNDSLVFKYNKGSDSVLRVTKDDYSSCNTKKPLKTMDSGSSVFQFDKSGPFFFISGNEDNCRKGQKLIVVVLAVRTKQTSTPAYPPATSPKAPSPEGHNPAQAPSRSSAPIANAPSSNAPTGAPGPSPVTKTPQTSPVPSKSPSPSPYAKPPAPAHSPESLTGSPGPSPVPLKTPSPLANTPSPSYHPVASPTPARSPSSSTPSPTPESSPGPSLSPGSNEANLAPAPARAASWVATPSTTMVIVASLLISSAISGWP
ncbi:hypothetical protein POTOM_039866 [Populus tomentosa]|uniref:Phytocyanin domain-containing protein n=1 Tax=Populus tomentosa TaxID=118781 RepID=A0A8X7YW27_POPTO|nr:hypothetical protein POTOM_039866 [Populus tomentosa]